MENGPTERSINWQLGIQATVRAALIQSDNSKGSDIFFI